MERSQRAELGTGRLVALAVVAIVVLVVGLAVFTRDQGPNRTVTGAATTVEPHRLCVAGDSTVCVGVDVPGRVSGVAVGDCVRMRYSAQAILISIRRLEPTECP